MSNAGQGKQYKEMKKRALDVASIPPLTVLPNSIDVVDFAKARMSEINLLKKDIDDAKYRGSRRVFQTLPKSMRRRAASFNIKRLPTRLRMKALQEIEKDPTSAPKKNKKPSCRRRLRRTKNIQEMAEKRQGNKRWLETHIWHAKRSKMIDIWGYRLALKPNDKCLRSTLKASKEGVVLHDASYLQVYELSGANGNMDNLFKAFSCPVGSTFEFLLLESDSHKVICPVKGIQIKMNENSTLCWLFVHPSALSDAKAEISKLAESFAVNFLELSNELNIFELTGNKTSETLSRVLRPVSGSLRLNSLCPLTVEDPRFSFPPKELEDYSFSSMDAGLNLKDSIFDKEYRIRCVGQCKTEKEINERRAKKIIPGQPLVPSPEDPSVPILIVPFSSKMLIAPEGWGRAFWKSLVFTKVRFDGLEQVRRIQEEEGHPAFPYDFPGTSAFNEYAESLSKELSVEYLAKPPSKRVNYEKLGITTPFKPPFDEDSWLLPSNVFKNAHDESTLSSFSNALVIGELVFTNRGSPEYNAVIFDETEQTVLGYVTTGYYSLRKGCGAGIGACYASRIHFAQVDGEIVANVKVQNINSVHKHPAIFKLSSLK